MRRAGTLAALVAVAGALLVLAAPAASAQTGYPPGVCTAITGTQDVGAVNVGQRFVLQLAPTCLFTPGAAITVTVNGVNIPGKVAETGGFVLVDITVVSTTQLSIDDPILVTAVCGTNTAVARGPSSTAAGGIATQTANFTVTCPTPLASAQVAQPIQARLSLTGSNTVRLAALALTLVAAGLVAVFFTRRRRSF